MSPVMSKLSLLLTGGLRSNRLPGTSSARLGKEHQVAGYGQALVSDLTLYEGL